MNPVAIILLALVLLGAYRLIAASQRRKGRLRALKGKSSFQANQLLDAQAPNSPAVAVDADSQKFALAYSGADVLFFEFPDLVEVEFKSNGDTLDTANRGNQVKGAIIGGLVTKGVGLGGGLGVLMGGVTGSRTSQQRIKRLSLMVYTNRLDRPAHEIVFFDHPQGQTMKDKQLVEAAKRANDWYARFRTILRATPQVVTIAQAPVISSGSDGIFRHREV